jgi:hypothetical protein
MNASIAQVLDIDLAPIIATGKKAYRAYFVALDALSGGNQFARRFPGEDLVALMAEPPFAALVDHFAALPDIDTEALGIKVRNVMRESATIQEAQLASGNTTATMARDIGDSAVKLATLLDRRNESPATKHPRKFAYIGSPIRVFSVGGEISEISTSGKSEDEVMRELLLALRVTDEGEAAAVLNTPRKYGASCTLPAW